MASNPQQIAHDILSLSEEDRIDIFMQLASSLPYEKIAIAESTRRAEEMCTGKVIALTEGNFRDRMDRLKQQFCKHV